MSNLSNVESTEHAVAEKSGRFKTFARKHLTQCQDLFQN